MSKKFLFAFAVLLIAVGAWSVVKGRCGSAGPSPPPPADRPAFQTGEFAVIRSDGTRLPFKAELALSEAEQAYGLMFIDSLPADQGMIFPYDPPREVAFWMKNTRIPLDMLFIRPDHTIGHIVTNARPLDVTPIASQIITAAVIEIKGGEVAKQGIKEGDKIESAAMK